MTIIGLDPHKDQHVAVAIDGNGRTLGCYQLANRPAAFVGLKRWAKQFGQVRWAIEGATSRFASEHHLASYCGAAPIRRGSGKSMRLCVNPGGNRRLNHVLHLAVMTRLRLNQRGARDYFEAKQAQGKSKRGAIRLLKTYLAREVYRALKATARTDVLLT